MQFSFFTTVKLGNSRKMFCTMCGVKLPDDSEKCSNCGKVFVKKASNSASEIKHNERDSKRCSTKSSKKSKGIMTGWIRQNPTNNDDKNDPPTQVIENNGLSKTDDQPKETPKIGIQEQFVKTVEKFLEKSTDDTDSATEGNKLLSAEQLKEVNTGLDLMNYSFRGYLIYTIVFGSNISIPNNNMGINLIVWLAVVICSIVSISKYMPVLKKIGALYFFNACIRIKLVLYFSILMHCLGFLYIGYIYGDFVTEDMASVNKGCIVFFVASSIVILIIKAYLVVRYINFCKAIKTIISGDIPEESKQVQMYTWLLSIIFISIFLVGFFNIYHL